MMITVMVRQADGRSVSRELRNGQCVVGRAARQSDLVVEDQAVSKAHLRISEERGELFVEDLESSNGTFLESERLLAGRKYPLQSGQAVYVGASLLTVSGEQSWEMTSIGAQVYKPRFVGVLYTDIVNSTVMTRRLGPEKGTALLEWHNQMFRERFKRYGGRETKFTGDGFEAVFPSVSDALGCAASSQRELARRNQQDASGFRLEVRMGVNGGEAPAAGRQIYGMPLILAARVMARASAAQVLVPQHVAGIVAGSLWHFEPIGAHDLKGLDEPVELLEFLWKLDPNVQAPPAPAQPAQR
jgi:class 3 adenylate cyclase